MFVNAPAINSIKYGAPTQTQTAITVIFAFNGTDRKSTEFIPILFRNELTGPIPFKRRRKISNVTNVGMAYGSININRQTFAKRIFFFASAKSRIKPQLKVKIVAQIAQMNVQRTTL
ncbi:hypothetical protein OFN53_28080, partial [Escherichia coli]|nr:hypothetical protein [Escherichia coli]